MLEFLIELLSRLSVRFFQWDNKVCTIHLKSKNKEKLTLLASKKGNAHFSPTTNEKSNNRHSFSNGGGKKYRPPF